MPSPYDHTLTSGVTAHTPHPGDVVRRRARQKDLAIRTFLRYLRHSGFERAPEPAGVNGDGCEAFDGIEGRTGYSPITDDIASDEALISAAQAIRGFHDLSARFAKWQRLEWDTRSADPTGQAEVICHNQLAPFNLVYREREVVAIVDWTRAAPGRRVWDLAYAAWWLVPLHGPMYARQMGWPAVDRRRRLALLAEAYGMTRQQRDELLEVVRQRQDHARHAMRRLTEIGHVELLVAGGDVVGQDRPLRERLTQ